MEALRKVRLVNRPPTTTASTSESNYDSSYSRFSSLKEDLESGAFGSLTDEVRSLFRHRFAPVSKRSLFTDPAASTNVPQAKRVRCSGSLMGHHDVCPDPVRAKPDVIVIDSDDEENGGDTAISSFLDVFPTTLDGKCCPAMEVIEPVGSSISASRHLADDTGHCGNEVAHTHTETEKNIGKSSVNPIISLDGSNITRGETLMAHHGNSVSEAAAQEQTVIVLNSDREDSLEDMSISPLREVSLTSPCGQFAADKVEDTDCQKNGVEVAGKSGFVTDVGCKPESIVDGTGRYGSEAVVNGNRTLAPRHLADDTAHNGAEVTHTHNETVEDTGMTPVIPCIRPDEKNVGKMDTLMAEHDVVTSEAAAQAQTDLVLNSNGEDSLEDMSISPLREVSPISSCVQFPSSTKVKELLDNNTTDCKKNDVDAGRKLGIIADDTGCYEMEAVDIRSGTSASKHLSDETGCYENEVARSHIETVEETGMTSQDPMLWKIDNSATDAESSEDGLADIWSQMSMALKFTESAEDLSSNAPIQDDEDCCEHSFIHKEDIGDVCRICGLISREITSMIDIQFIKAKRSGRTYVSSPRDAKYKSTNEVVGVHQVDITATDMCPHPRHRKLMKAHQVEGFNFLCSNLVCDNPGGCILAHAPGSGKTFMIISFMQSFLARYPNARPLVVLPKGILHTWRKEFETWRVEDFPIHDFYTAKAESRAQQLQVLKKWVDKKSVLLLGYKQFSSVICDHGKSSESANCQKILLQQPSVLVLDEGHTPRNENTDVLQSLARIQTPRKIVLSGTLYQNHVKEVFNVLNLVRPNFLKLNTTQPIIKRIFSKAVIPRGMKQVRAGADATFCEVVEHTLQQGADFKSKVSLIRDLREMTNSVLHYYKGDFLDELPGLVDLTVVLNLSKRQKDEVEKLKTLPGKFKRAAVGSAVYLHPELNSISENSAATEKAMDTLLGKIDIKDGVKTKFFMNLLKLCEISNEKMVVFSQYLTPLKFLERLLTREKNWNMGREMFMISGDSSTESRERSVESFNNSGDAKIFFGSIKACGEGISLVGGSRVIVLDVHLNPSITRQAVGRAFRPGQKKVVYVYRLIAADSPEEEDYHTCFRKEVISKMWFEWNELCGFLDFKVEPVKVEECGDALMEHPNIAGDVRALYKR